MEMYENEVSPNKTKVKLFCWNSHLHGFFCSHRISLFYQISEIFHFWISSKFLLLAFQNLPLLSSFYILCYPFYPFYKIYKVEEYFSLSYSNFECILDVGWRFYWDELMISDWKLILRGKVGKEYLGILLFSSSNL